MYEITVKGHFSAAHNLRGYKGECENLHGHNWLVEVVLAGENVNELGMLADFRIVKEMLSEVLAQYDHRYLNELPAFKKVNPTTENIARLVAEAFAKRLPWPVRVSSVSVGESEIYSARYTASGRTKPARRKK